LATIESILRVFDHYGNRDNKLRARMKWLVDTIGIDELRARIFKERRFLLGSHTWPGGIPELVEEGGRAPAGVDTAVDSTPVRVPVELRLSRELSPYDQWDRASVIRGVARGTVSAVAFAPLGDITSAQFRALADIQRDLGVELRVTNRQNVVFRGLQNE